MLKLLLTAALGAVVVVAGCSSSSSGPSSGCSSETPCANGAGSMQACYTQDSTGACATLSYKVGSQVFDCVSCDDEAYCKNAALVACGVPEASVPPDADLPENYVPPTDSGPAADAATRPSDASSDVSSSPADTGAAADTGAGDASHE